MINNNDDEIETEEIPLIKEKIERHIAVISPFWSL